MVAVVSLVLFLCGVVLVSLPEVKCMDCAGRARKLKRKSKIDTSYYLDVDVSVESGSLR